MRRFFLVYRSKALFRFTSQAGFRKFSAFRVKLRIGSHEKLDSREKIVNFYPISTSTMRNYRFTLARRLVFSLSIVALMSGVLVYGASQMTLPGIATDVATAKPTRAFPDPAADLTASAAAGSQTAVFAGGCFWGMEAVFEHVKGVTGVVSGYAGGTDETAHYGQVSSGTTGHAEGVQIIYDPAQVSYGQLLKVYFSVAHNPTELNRQGPDTGTQYRSAIFVETQQQPLVAQAYIDQLNAAKVFDQAIATQIEPLTEFYAAEDYHQDFIAQNPSYPYVIIHDLPKIAQLQAQWPDLYRN